MVQLNSRLRRPVARPDVTAFPLDGDVVLHDPQTGQAHVLNPTAACVWSLCDGSRSTSGVAKALAATYTVPYRQTLADVRELIVALHSAGLLATH